MTFPAPVILFTPKEGRTCDACTACCTVLGVYDNALNKSPWQPCQHLATKLKQGCTIYAQRPHDCEIWSCLWRRGHLDGDHLRPDRSGLILDVQRDEQVVEQGRQFRLVLIWEAQRHALRRFANVILLKKLTQQSVCYLIPYGQVAEEPVGNGDNFMQRIRGPADSVAKVRAYIIKVISDNEISRIYP
jgi:hypothetical protein